MNLIAEFSNGEGNIDNGVGIVTSGVNITVSPITSTAYTLTVVNAENISVTSMVTINVIEPSITNFSASATTILTGTSVNLIAQFSNGEGNIDNGVGIVTSGIAQSVTPTSSTTYTLKVTNENGVLVTSSVIIDVVPIIMNVNYPTNNQNVTDKLYINATIRSELDVVTVVAVVENRSITLSYSDGFFKGELLLSGLAAGDYTLMVTAEDVEARSDTQTVNITLDNKPLLTVTEPIDYSVATTTLPINSSCTDDVSDCLITVKVGGTTLASKNNVISESIDLKDYDGQTVTLIIEGKDSLNRVTSISRTIHVESSDNLILVKDFAGLILDFDEQKALILISEDNGDKLKVSDIVTDSFDSVEVLPNLIVSTSNSFLTPTGTIYTAQEVGGSGLTSKIYDWNESVLFDLGHPNSGLSLTVAGDYAQWSKGSSLWLRTLSTKQDTLVSSSAGNWHNAVASNGVVGYWSYDNNYSIVKFENETHTTLATDNDYWNTYVITDGTQFLYRKHDACCSNQEYAITLHDGFSEIVLTDFRDTEPRAGKDYSINNGWVAFTELGGIGQTHVWSRDISGNFLQRTFSGSSSYIDGLAPNGDIILVNSGNRYLSNYDEELKYISSTLGKSVYINSTWYIAIGRSLFKVKTL